jgi:hypothetical protein
VQNRWPLPTCPRRRQTKTAWNPFLSVGSPEFLEGLRWGGITGGGVGLLVGLAWRRWRRKPAPLTGLAATLAAPLAMAVTRPIQSTVWAGLGLLVLSGVAFLGPADFRSWCFSRCFLVPYGEALTPAALLDRISSSIGRGITQRASDWC